MHFTFAKKMTKKVSEMGKWISLCQKKCTNRLIMCI